MSADTFTKETERTRRIWEKQAPRYDRSIAFWEKILFGDGRRWVCSRTHGEVLEVAIGTGRNFAFYPEGVRLTGIDLSPAMLEIARERARELGMDADLREGDAQQLPFADASFDTVVCTLSLCNIPDDRKAVAEMKRVLRPGGQLLLLDHIRAASGLLRAVQKALEVVTVRLEGEHLMRRPLEHVQAEGFEVEQRERYKGGIVERLSARRPG
jgi:ubiquinone/menaquinone biosynthesis C-methylase UbiE